MAIGTDIRERGFRRWYERELLRSHSHLVLLLLCAVAALGAVEAFSQGGSDRALMVVSLLVAAALGAWAMRRYLFFLMRAEALANQASCPHCGSYARWQVEQVEQGPAGAADTGQIVVSCRKCQHRWPISW